MAEKPLPSSGQKVGKPRKIEVVLPPNLNRALEARLQQCGYRTLSECIRDLVRKFVAKDEMV